MNKEIDIKIHSKQQHFLKVQRWVNIVLNYFFPIKLNVSIRERLQFELKFE